MLLRSASFTWNGACSCSFEDIVQHAILKILTSWSSCADPNYCHVESDFYLSSCMKVHELGGDTIALSCCPNEDGCCKERFEVCPDGYGGFTVTSISYEQLGSPCTSAPGSIGTDLESIIDNCYAFCDLFPSDAPIHVEPTFAERMPQ